MLRELESLTEQDTDYLLKLDALNELKLLPKQNQIGKALNIQQDDNNFKLENTGTKLSELELN